VPKTDKKTKKCRFSQKCQMQTYFTVGRMSSKPFLQYFTCRRTFVVRELSPKKRRARRRLLAVPKELEREKNAKVLYHVTRNNRKGRERCKQWWQTEEKPRRHSKPHIWGFAPRMPFEFLSFSSEDLGFSRFCCVAII